MGQWESHGRSDEWYTPKYIFDALGERFDLDVSAPACGPRHVPCKAFISEDSLNKHWHGFVWMNPPFGGRNGLEPWLEKFFENGNGIALTPDRTSSPWWQRAAMRSDAMLFVGRKIKFERPDGSLGVSPANGTTLMGIGYRAVKSLERASVNALGILVRR